ncbi:hypothetical protein HW053_001472 [Campylobacter jejuni]|nr:hypothetical protein [Campylobacter jejuni]HEG5317656.1 hypothetical protein [Campylobacter jejuni]
MSEFLKDLLPFDDRRTRFISYCQLQCINLEKEFNHKNNRFMYVLDLETFKKIKESYKNYKKRGCYTKQGNVLELALKEIEIKFNEKELLCGN